MSTPLFETTPITPRSAEVTLTVSNRCVCRYCPDCSVGTSEDPCPDCSGDTEPADCAGECFQLDRDAVQDFWQAWVAENPSMSGQYRINGSNMGWRHLDGWTEIDEHADVVATIGVDSEWTQQWTINPVLGGCCEATQSHHDAMGEHYVVTVADD